MGRAPPPPLPLLLVLLAAAATVTVTPAGGYIEVLEEFRCHDAEFRLTCRHLDAHLAILEASFSPAAAPGAGPDPLPPVRRGQAAAAAAAAAAACAGNGSTPAPGSGPFPVRPALNLRCSGVNHCSFILQEDCKPAALWGPGLLYIKYACMEGANSSSSCSRAVTASGEGFLQTPGYPRFYVGEQRCRWSVRAPPGQRVRLQLLDISLRVNTTMEPNCTDYISVTEDGRTLFSTCGDEDDLVEILSEGETVDVTISSGSKTLYPKRGVLLHYKAIGCVHPPTPEDGYVIYKNDTYAEYICCVGFVFPDTLERRRILQCINNNTWNTTLPDCKRHGGITDGTYNIIGPMRLNADNSTVYASAIKETDLMLDVLLPTIIICILLVGNGVVIFVIYYLRKRRLSRNNEEEAGAICQPLDASEKAINV